MRILDCKEKRCKELNQGAPIILDYLCDECQEHFEKVKEYLTANGIEFEIDASIVRGLDYYTKTVFEFISEEDGLTVLGGGRYDGLVEEVGGVHTPAVGFAMGMERLLEVFDRANKDSVEEKKMDLYIANIGEKGDILATKLATELRNEGIFVEKDICSRSLKAQFKYADKMNAKYVITIGDDEVNNSRAKIKNMKSGEERDIKLEREDIKKIIQ